MNTPKLDAFLKEVDALDAKMRCGRIADAIGAAEEVVGYTPTLAAMLRVAVERIAALRAVAEDARELARTMRDQYANGRDPAKYDEWDGEAVRARAAVEETDAALARIEQIAAESRSDDPGTAEEGAV